MAQKNGRTPPPEKLYDFTFRDTGRTVQIRKISTLLRAEVRRGLVAQPAYAEPQPPQSEVDYGEGKVRIPNPAHPVYQQLLAAWRGRLQDAISERLKVLAIKRGVVCAVDSDALARARANALEDGIDLSGYDDHYAYVAFVCIGSEDDWAELLRAIFERAAPQEAAVQSHIEAFQPDVQRQAAVQPES
jgi:hypothetical protein